MRHLERAACIKAAMERTPTLVIKNANVVNVFTKEIFHGDVAVCGRTVIGVGNYSCENEYDAAGAYLTPGLIDAHVHIESSLVTPASFAKVILPAGTTTVIADPHEIANVCGSSGIEAMYDLSQGLPLNVLFMIPSCVPATPFEHSGAVLRAEDMRGFVGRDRILGLGEVMDYVSVTTAERAMMDKLDLFDHFPMDGHAPLLSGDVLNAYCTAGPCSDHECSNYDEALEKLRCGMYLLLRMGSEAHGVEDILRRIAKDGLPTDRIMFCTDDKHIESIYAQGHVNYILKRAVAMGIDPMDAVRMATMNPARAYGIRRTGAIAPGYRADFVLFRDLKDFEVVSVFTGGRLYAGDFPYDRSVPEHMLFSVNHAPVKESDLALPASEKMPVIRMVRHQLVNKLEFLSVPAENGLFVSRNGLNKLAVIERHHALGNVGLGIVEGLSIVGGAIASTVAHDSHNIVVAGDNDRDMLVAIDALTACGGGYAVVNHGEVAALLPLPIAGLMSDAPIDQVLGLQKRVLEAAHSIGVPTDCDPLHSLSFLALPVIPEARVTDEGFFDVTHMRFI